MNVIDTFLFSESYEAELLLLKLHLESPVVTHWVLVESDVTFRGEPTGLHAKKLLEDKRFAPFRDSVTVVEHHGRLFDGPACYDTYLKNEVRSRESAWPFINSFSKNEDWVIVSDVDEAVDCTDPIRHAKFIEHLHANGDATLFFQHYRYWYDFSNLTKYKGVVTPVANVGAIRNDKSSLAARTRIVHERVDFPSDPEPLFFEYTFCFPREAMWKKLTSFIHDGYTEEELRLALLTNTWVKSAARGEKVGQRHDDWFETVILTEQNSPKYVRDNLSRLKTNAVSPDYKEHRRSIYGVS